MHRQLREHYEANGTEVIPPGVHLLPDTRIGDEARDSYLTRLREVYSTGHLDAAEHAARQDAALAARTRAELDLLVRDLPPAKVPEAHGNRAESRLYLAMSILGMISMGSFAVIFPVSRTGWIMFTVYMLLAAGFAALSLASWKKKA